MSSAPDVIESNWIKIVKTLNIKTFFPVSLDSIALGAVPPNLEPLKLNNFFYLFYNLYQILFAPIYELAYVVDFKNDLWM